MGSKFFIVLIYTVLILTNIPGAIKGNTISIIVIPIIVVFGVLAYSFTE